MHQARSFRVTLALLAIAPLASHAANDRWGYAYRNIDVTASGTTSAYAVNVAHYCVRLDAMLTRLLGIKSSYRPLTHIYAVPAGVMQQYTGGADYESTYQTSNGETTIIVDISALSNGRSYFGAYFGYTATLLSSDQLLSGPDWYMVGVPSAFADVVFEHGRAKIGNITPGFAYILSTGSALSPMRTFLTMKQRDAELTGKASADLFNAEAWFLAREVFIEGKHRSEFGKYLDLMRHGTDEPAAFAASFSISYEALDKELALAMREHAHVYIVEAPDDPIPGGEAAQALSAAELKARLAMASLRYRKGPDPVQLANEALAIEPHNQTALLALALGELKRDAYGDSLAALDKLTAQTPADAAYPDIAYVLAALAEASAGGRATLPVAADALRQRARQAYERALAANSEDRRSRQGLAELNRSGSGAATAAGEARER